MFTQRPFIIEGGKGWFYFILLAMCNWAGNAAIMVNLITERQRGGGEEGLIVG